MRIGYAVVCAGVMVSLWAACGDDETNGTTSTASATGGNGGTGGMATSTTSMSSASVSSASSGGAMPGVCTDDAYCDDLAESCTCPDCDHDINCGDPADYFCVDDNVCDDNVYEEGCGCTDCYAHPDCVDNVAACENGTPDGLCDLNVETCDCVDCLGTICGDPCNSDQICDFEESCHCADCVTDSFCTDPNNCFDDQICAPFYEGCHCTDCTNVPSCGGSGGGGAGGTGGSGGSGGN